MRSMSTCAYTTFTDPATGTEFRVFPTPDPDLHRVEVWRCGVRENTHVVAPKATGGHEVISSY